MSSQEEHEIQKNAISHLYDWFRAFHPELCILTKNSKGKETIKPVLYANTNAGARSVRLASYMKAEGLFSGILDLTLALARKGYHGLYIEVKLPKRGKKKATELSFNQIQVIDYLERQGYLTAVCRSTQEIIDTVQKYVD